MGAMVLEEEPEVAEEMIGDTQEMELMVPKTGATQELQNLKLHLEEPQGTGATQALEALRLREPPDLEDTLEWQLQQSPEVLAPLLTLAPVSSQLRARGKRGARNKV